MSTKKAYRRETLPKWAQQEFETLGMRLQEAREQIAELTNREPTRVELEPYRDKPLSYLPDRTRIRFALTDEYKSWQDFIDVTLRGDHVEISGSDTLEIAPWASNIIHLRLRDKP
jgi:hypothetical protein